MERLFPGERVWRLAYSGEEAIYRDSLHRRVVADAKGPGLYNILSGEMTCFADGVEVKQSSGSFFRSFVAVAPGEDFCKVELHLGRTTPLNPVFWRVPDHVKEFCGWLLAPEGWSFLEPVFTYEALNPDRPTGAPALHQCLTAASFFLRNEEAAHEHNLQFGETPQFTRSANFPAPFAQITGQMTFDVHIVEENEGVQLARLADSARSPQSALVYVDDAFAGEWYYPFSSIDEPVVADLFGIPTELTRGKSKASIRLEVPEECVPFATAWIGVDALVPRVQ